MQKHVLTIAGSDSCGGAGIQADLKTMCALGVYGMSVVAAVTAQNTRAVLDVQEISPEMVQKQIDAIFTDIRVDAVKIGMLSSPEIILAVRERLERYRPPHIVLDPVMVSKSGYRLLRPEAIDALRALIPLAEIITPNIPEAEILTGSGIQTEEDMRAAARALAGPGSRHAVLLKGGHRLDSASDLLFHNGGFQVFPQDRIPTTNTHGTGCTLSSAVACFMALGNPLPAAVRLAKDYITQAIADSFPVGHGVGPVGHLVGLYRKAGMLPP